VSSSVSAITAKSSAYSSSHGRATVNSVDMASMTITNNSGLNAESGFGGEADGCGMCPRNSVERFWV